MEGPAGNEQDMIGLHHAVLGADGRPFHDRQQIALHPLPRDFRTMAAATAAGSDLVDLVEENDAGFFRAPQGLLDDRVHVDQFFHLFLFCRIQRLGHLHLPSLLLTRKNLAEGILQAGLHILHAGGGHDLHHRHRFRFGQGNLQLPVVELAFPQHFPELFPGRRLPRLFFFAGQIGIVDGK